jgi:hypothetical protein
MRKFSWPTPRLPHPRLPAITIMSLLPTLRTRLNFGGTKVTIGALAIVAIGFTATIWVTVAGSTHEIIFPTPGAEYELPSIVGERLPPDDQTPMTASQTLRVGFKDGTRLDRVVLKNLDLGKADLATAFQITRNATTGVTGAQAYLFIGDVVITNSSGPTLAWGNMELGSVTLAARVDGHTQEIQQDSTVTQIIIDSDRGSGTYTAQDSKVDRVILQINGTNGASIGVLEIDNVDISTGAMEWNYIKAGSLSLDGSNEFGNGTGINNSSATWADTISARTIVDNLVDVPISVK